MVLMKRKAVCSAVICCALIMSGIALTSCTADHPESDKYSTAFEVNDKKIPYEEGGYSSEEEYLSDLEAKQMDSIGMADEAINKYANVITEEQKQTLKECEQEMVISFKISEYNEWLDKFNSVVSELEKARIAAEEEAKEKAAEEAAAAEAEASANVEAAYYDNYSGNNYTYYSNGSGLTPQSGVNWHNGRKETYYSSNVLYHYMTPQWTLGDDGVYRTSEGYVVVAASDLPYGSTVETSFGTGQVLDTGCASGVTDIYTAW